jgi:hypothetical protein
MGPIRNPHWEQKWTEGYVAKPEIVVLGSWIRFRYFIFKISGNPPFVLKQFSVYDELRSFSAFFALNFDKKLAVE